MQVVNVGTPGSGKTYDAMIRLVSMLKLGREVYTNISGLDARQQRENLRLQSGLDDYQIECLLHCVTDKEMLQKGFFDSLPPQAVVFIDEAHKLFSNRDWASETNKDFCEWASTHRHNGHDIFLITQDMEKLDKHLRSLTEWTHFFRKINFFGKLVKAQYMRYTYDGDQVKGKPISSERLTYNPAIFRTYKSYDTAQIKEMGLGTSTNVLKHPVFYAIPVCLVLMLWSGSKSSLMTGDVFGSKKMVSSPAQKKAVPPVAPIKKAQIETSLTEKKVDVVPPESPAPVCGSMTYKLNGVLGMGNSLPVGAQLLKCFPKVDRSQPYKTSASAVALK